MTELAFPPGLILVLGALFVPFLAKLRTVLIIGLPVICLLFVWLLPDSYILSWSFMGFELEPIRVSVIGRLFATVFAVMTLVGGIYASRQATNFELTAALIYAGSAIGVTLAGDLITLFIFWELMAIGSTLVIWAAGHEAAYRASMRYLLIHLLGGVILMAGITGHIV
jgi:multicomponent Na+:H+ antiporter subunit D